MLSAVLALDGFDLLILSFLAPTLSKEFGLSKIALGLVLTLSHTGVAVGGLIGGFLGDKFGQRRTLVAGVAAFGLFAVLCGVCPTPSLFASMRFFSAIGLGAVTPNAAVCLVNVLAPQWRDRLTVFAFSVSALGAAMAGLLVKATLSLISWRYFFFIGGIVPLLMCPLIWKYIPDTTDSLPRGGPKTPARQVPVSLMFNRAYLVDTLVLWLITFTVMLSAIAMTSMGTIILISGHVPLQTALSGLLAFNLAGVAGAVCAAFAIPKVGFRATMAALLTIGIMGLLLLDFVLTGSSRHAVIGCMLLSGLGLSGEYTLLYPLLAQAYPAAVRATGTGTALAIGRVGAILSATIVAGILSLAGPSGALLGLAGTACIALLAVLAWRGRFTAPGVRQIDTGVPD